MAEESTLSFDKSLPSPKSQSSRNIEPLLEEELLPPGRINRGRARPEGTWDKPLTVQNLIHLCGIVLVEKDRLLAKPALEVDGLGSITVAVERRVISKAGFITRLTAEPSQIPGPSEMSSGIFHFCIHAYNDWIAVMAKNLKSQVPFFSGIEGWMRQELFGRHWNPSPGSLIPHIYLMNLSLFLGKISRLKRIKANYDNITVGHRSYFTYPKAGHMFAAIIDLPDEDLLLQLALAMMDVNLGVTLMQVVNTRITQPISKERYHSNAEYLEIVSFLRGPGFETAVSMSNLIATRKMNIHQFSERVDFSCEVLLSLTGIFNEHALGDLVSRELAHYSR